MREVFFSTSARELRQGNAMLLAQLFSASGLFVNHQRLRLLSGSSASSSAASSSLASSLLSSSSASSPVHVVYVCCGKLTDRLILHRVGDGLD